MQMQTRSYLIAVTSITYGIKAQNLLNNKGFSCDIQRTPKNFSTGCGYSIRVTGAKEAILQLLKDHGIKVVDIREAGSDSPSKGGGPR